MGDVCDNCPIFPNLDQTDPGVCRAQPYDGLAPDQATRFDAGLEEFAHPGERHHDGYLLGAG